MRKHEKTAFDNRPFDNPFAASSAAVTLLAVGANKSKKSDEKLATRVALGTTWTQ